MFKRKRKIAGLLAILMAFSLAFSGAPMVSATVLDDNVSVTVRDTTGNKGSITNFSGFRNDITSAKGTSLLGDSYADIKYYGSAASKLEYQIVNSAYLPQNGLPSTGWNPISLRGTTTNADVDIDHPGNLKRRSYDVTMLPNIKDTSTWENRNLVYKYPFAASEDVSTATSTSNESYGSYIDYFDYNDVKNRRFYSNTVFGMSITNGKNDLYPPDDTVSYNGNSYAKYQEASKFWGYMKVPTDGNYYLGLVSDDGSTGTITVNGKTKVFADQFKVQGSKWDSDNKSVYLEADIYYPVFMEYFNWGGGARFQMFYSESVGFSSSSNSIPSNAIEVGSNWFYPSYSTAPGEYADTTFTGSYGVKLPSKAGDYYVLYRSSKSDGATVQSGSYGPFVVLGNADVSIGKRSVNTDGSPLSSIVAGNQFNIEYSIRPESIVATSNFNKAASISLKDVRIEDELNSDFTILKSSDENFLPDGTKFLVTGSKITYLLPEIKYNLSSDGKNYIPLKSEYIYTVPVKLNVVGTNMLISKADASKMTFTDPCDDSKITKNFGNIIIQATPKAPSVLADIIVATLQNVALTATYTDNPTSKEYKTGATGAWLAYSGPVIATDNETYYFRGGDSVGNYSAETPFTVNNITVATGISLKLKNGRADTSVTKLGKLNAVLAYTTRATGIPEFVLICPAGSETLFNNLSVKSTIVTDTQGIMYDVSKESSGIKIKARNSIVKSTSVKKITLVFNVKKPVYSLKGKYYNLEVNNSVNSLNDSVSSLKVRVVRPPKIY